VTEFNETILNLGSCPAIGADGTIYIGSDDYHLYAISRSGTLVWKYKTGGVIQSSPALDSFGNVYVGSQDGFLNAIDSTGSLKWAYNMTDKDIWGSPAVGSDGAIYLGSGDYLHSISPQGATYWKFYTGPWLASSPGWSIFHSFMLLCVCV
jgi:outer membrane protein assembly factor BamB